MTQPPVGHGDVGMDPDLMTVSKAAAFLRVRPTELMTAVRAGEIPFYRVAGRVLLSRSELTERLRRGIGQRGEQ